MGWPMIAARRIVTMAADHFRGGLAASVAFDMAVVFEAARRDTNPISVQGLSMAERIFDAWVGEGAK